MLFLSCISFFLYFILQFYCRTSIELSTVYRAMSASLDVSVARYLLSLLACILVFVFSSFCIYFRALFYNVPLVVCSVPFETFVLARLRFCLARPNSCGCTVDSYEARMLLLKNYLRLLSWPSPSLLNG